MYHGHIEKLRLQKFLMVFQVILHLCLDHTRKNLNLSLIFVENIAYLSCLRILDVENNNNTHLHRQFHNQKLHKCSHNVNSPCHFSVLESFRKWMPVF